ncbi:MAG: DUF721 domain-containing protein [Actinobacteria bacterium]|nr:DUF721 domain-containing protein [Actinomycetota bacterium]
MNSIGEVIKRAIKKPGSIRKIKEYSIVAAWQQIVGQKLAANSYPIKIRDGTVIVVAKDNMWAAELKYMSALIIKKINEFLKEDLIKDIRFSTYILFDPGRAVLYEEESNNEIGSIELSDEQKRMIDSNLKWIEDEELRNRMQKLLYKDLIFRNSKSRFTQEH